MTENEQKLEKANKKIANEKKLKKTAAKILERRKQAQEKKHKEAARQEQAEEKRQKKVKARGALGAHIAADAQEAVLYPGAYDDDWAGSPNAEAESDESDADAGKLPPCAHGDPDAVDDIEPSLCPGSSASHSQEVKTIAAHKRARVREEKLLIAVEEPEQWKPLTEPIMRDTSCPSAFTPKHFAGQLSLQAQQGCCVLDKVLGAVELLWHLRKCQHWRMRYHDPHEIARAEARGVALPCQVDAVETFAADVHSCCCNLPGRPGKMMTSASGDHCAHAQKCYMDGDDSGIWQKLESLQHDFTVCAAWRPDARNLRHDSAAGDERHHEANAHCISAKKGLVDIVKKLLGMSKAQYKLVPREITAAAGNLLSMCDGRMWFGSCLPHINLLIRYQFHRAHHNTTTPTPAPKIMTTADYNMAYSDGDGDK
eukprot:g1305.t1